jgi:hypothetical protein
VWLKSPRLQLLSCWLLPWIFINNQTKNNYVFHPFNVRMTFFINTPITIIVQLCPHYRTTNYATIMTQSVNYLKFANILPLSYWKFATIMKLINYNWTHIILQLRSNLCHVNFHWIFINKQINFANVCPQSNLQMILFHQSIHIVWQCDNLVQPNQWQLINNL